MPRPRVDVDKVFPSVDVAVADIADIADIADRSNGRRRWAAAAAQERGSLQWV